MSDCSMACFTVRQAPDTDIRTPSDSRGNHREMNLPPTGLSTLFRMFECGRISPGFSHDPRADMYDCLPTKEPKGRIISRP